MAGPTFHGVSTLIGPKTFLRRRRRRHRRINNAKANSTGKCLSQVPPDEIYFLFPKT
jgi:hypothetical protein